VATSRGWLGLRRSRRAPGFVRDQKKHGGRAAGSSKTHTDRASSVAQATSRGLVPDQADL